MLKKYKIANFENSEKVIFKRSKYNGKFRCGCDCSLRWKCRFGIINLNNVCEIFRGIRTPNINIYAYYPKNDIKEE